MKDIKFNPQSLTQKLAQLGTRLQRYSLISFVIFVVLIYSFVAYRINTLRTTEPTSDQVASQVKAGSVPHIDEAIVKQLQTLQDNSVSVKALFDNARSNPFQ